MDDQKFLKKELDHYLSEKKFDLAEKKCKDLVSVNPNGFLFNYLGYINFLKSDFEEAIKNYKESLSYKENEFIVFQNIGECYLKLQNFILAKEFFIKSLSKNIVNLSNIKKVYHLSNYDLNYKDIYRLLDFNNLIQFLKKKDAKFIYELVDFLVYENETNLLYQYASSDLNKIFLLEDETLYLKGYIYFNLNLFRLAKDYFLKISNNFFQNQAYFFLADIYGMEGNIFLAYKYFIKIYKNKMMTPQLLRTVSMFYKFKSKKSNLYKKIDTFYTHQKNLLDDNGKANIYFAQAKADEDLQNYENSFKILEKANDAMNKNINFDFEKIQSEINFYKKNFTAKFYEKFKDSGYKKISPIFIVGLPRSGSTILEQIISNSKVVDPLSEIKTFRHTLKYFFNIYDPVHFVKQLTNLKANDIYNLGKKYHDSVFYLTSKDRFTDKMLFNFNYLILIKVALPNSKIIITKRNYKDVFLSIYKHYFSDFNLNFAYNKNNILSFIKIYDEMIKYSSNILKNDLIFFDYDKFVQKPNLYLKEVFNYCNLKWNDQFLEAGNKNYISTASRSQARKKIYKSSFKNYEFYLSYLKESFKELDKL